MRTGACDDGAVNIPRARSSWPADAVECDECGGAGWIEAGRRGEPDTYWAVCHMCGGWGYVVVDMQGGQDV
jgi:DnaJ-class molecular chaperone